jgi:hypothetical protein
MRPAPACRGAPPQLFDSVDILSHQRARVICATCPLVQHCIHHAISVATVHTNEPALRGPDGTWGGLLWRDGQVVDPKQAKTWRHSHHKRSA